MIASTNTEGCDRQGAGGPRVLLFTIVRNEAKILERCLDAAAPFVDAVLVVDTGSTDDTVAVARAYAVRRTFVVQHEWKDFGHNRTLSFEAARRCCVDDLGWSLEETYGLTLDADMRPGGLAPAAPRAPDTRPRRRPRRAAPRAAGVHEHALAAPRGPLALLRRHARGLDAGAGDAEVPLSHRGALHR